MDLQDEIDLQKELTEVKEYAKATEARARELNTLAENAMANVVAAAHLKGAGASFIAEYLGIPRQRVYTLLALKGIRPGKGIASVNANP